MNHQIRLRHNLDPNAFMWLWAKYVTGFRDDKHCTNALKGPYSRRLSRHNDALRSSPVLILDEHPGFEWIYVCGLIRKGYPRQNYEHNLHAVIRPAPGRRDRFSFENWKLEVHNGVFVPIPSKGALPDKYRGLGPEFTTCRIFRFAAAQIARRASRDRMPTSGAPLRQAPRELASSNETRRRSRRSKAAPSAEQHLRFLSNLQRVLDEGLFVATYKFALMMALADLCLEHGSDTTSRLCVDTREIAEKFILYYWRQTAQFPSPYAPPAVLVQATGSQAAILKRIEAARDETKGSIVSARANAELWEALVGSTAKTIREMPLWKLQTVAGKKLSLLYENVGRGSQVNLLPGVAAGFRKFYPLIRSVIQGEWVRQVRSIGANQQLLGEGVDLDSFLFGSDRASLQAYRPILTEVQHGRCFYCERSVVNDQSAVDHFIPWSRYPVDLAHNFVLAHGSCNASKKDHLASFHHLDRWAQRNHEQLDLIRMFEDKGLYHDVQVSNSVAQWAYDRAYEANDDTWVKGKTFEKLPRRFAVYSIWSRSNGRKNSRNRRRRDGK